MPQLALPSRPEEPPQADCHMARAPAVHYLHYILHWKLYTTLYTRLYIVQYIINCTVQWTV